jgi:hypothetical protein
MPIFRVNARDQRPELLGLVPYWFVVGDLKAPEHSVSASWKIGCVRPLLLPFRRAERAKRHGRMNGLRTMIEKAKYLMIVSMDVDAEHEALFNEVYDQEHIPNLKASSWCAWDCAL